MITSKSNGALISIILSIFFCFNGISLKAQISDEQIQAFRSAKSLAIEVNQSYAELKANDLMPYSEVPERLAKLTGIQIIDSYLKSADLFLFIKAEGTLYETKKPLTVRGDIEDPVWYEGVQLKGFISLEMDNILPSVTEFSDQKAFHAMDMRLYGNKAMAEPDKIPEYYRSLYYQSYLDEIISLFTGIYQLEPFYVYSDLLNSDDQELSIIAINKLGELGDSRSIELLIPLLRKGKIRSAVDSALQQITGQNFNSDWHKWEKWWDEHKLEYL
jgi:hypothetical protein